MFGPIDVDLGSLQDVFRMLATTPGKSVELEKMPFVVPFDGVRIRLSCPAPTPHGHKVGREGVVRIEGLSGPAFDWICAAEAWDDLVEVLDPVIRSEGPCHQYLTDFTSDGVPGDATVVVSKGEYADDVVRNSQ